MTTFPCLRLLFARYYFSRTAVCFAGSIQTRVRAAAARRNITPDPLLPTGAMGPSALSLELNYPHGTDRTVATRVNLVNLGTAKMLTIPGEALPNIGLYLKRKMQGEHNFLMGLTNDAFGYIPTKVEFSSFPIYQYASRVSLGEMTGETYIENALDLIRGSQTAK